jgi:hypothetical protein
MSAPMTKAARGFKIVRCAEAVRDWVMWLLLALEALGAAVTALAMLGCFAYGMFKMWGGAKGAIAAARLSAPGAGADIGEATLIHSLLGGLEMFFLAPLPYLAFESILRLVKAMQEEARPLSGDAQMAARAKLELAQERVGHVKRLITALMIAIVSTELIHRLIGGSPDALRTDAPAFWIPSAVILGLILSLSFYYRVSGTH